MINDPLLRIHEQIPFAYLLTRVGKDLEPGAESAGEAAPSLVDQGQSRDHYDNVVVTVARDEGVNNEALAEAGRCAQDYVFVIEQVVVNGALLSVENEILAVETEGTMGLVSQEISVIAEKIRVNVRIQTMRTD
jgi:hypothetical protein